MGGMHSESRADMYIVPHIKQTASGKGLYNTGSSAQCCEALGVGWGAAERETQEGKDICILRVGSHCWTVETSNIVKQSQANKKRSLHYTHN